MRGAAVDVRFDGTHLLLDLSDGRAVRFPLNWSPVRETATPAEREQICHLDGPLAIVLA
ncbi:DUF2442 domain-containing protein [Paraburkholderia sp. 40]|uniref:DUF2442 domain-containing protein n=1 Tax=unclassified Paraburkholderia TaxID=2615204 RepID=UPI003D2446B0